MSRSAAIEIGAGVRERYPDVLTPKALDVIADLADLDRDRKDVMHARLDRRRRRAQNAERIQFLDPESIIPRTDIKVADARAGRFTGSAIPDDLQCQWIQGTGPGAKPRSPIEKSIRNVAYALLSGADGWMFDGEDALGQIETMSLDNQRNLRLAFARDPIFLTAAETVAGQMNKWGEDFFGHKIIKDWQQQLSFTTRIFRARGLHLEDRHIRNGDGSGFSASIVDAALYVAANHATLANQGSSLVLYLPKIQTGEEAALWHEILGGVESSLDLQSGAIKTYVLVEQIEASFQLMEIRAALGNRFVGFNTGRWDYINSVADAMAWDPGFIHPNIDAVVMTYGYMRNYEDRVRRSTNTPDEKGSIRTLAGRHGTQYSGWLRGGSIRKHEESDPRRRTRTKRGCQRKVGSPLEDGANYSACLGESRAGEPSGPLIPAPDIHRSRRRRFGASRAGTTNNPRGPRPDQRGPPVRQRLRAGDSRQQP